LIIFPAAEIGDYCWLTREFDGLIRNQAAQLGLPRPDVYLISHILLNRITIECKDTALREKWIAQIDQKQGRKFPFIVFEDNEKEYVRLLGEDRAITLGGRGGAAAGCWRVCNVNNDRLHGDLGCDLAEDREKMRRMLAAGGAGSMAYIFQWSNTEVFGYLGSQYLWRSEGVPGINNADDFGFLEYAYRVYYGGAAGSLAGKAFAVNSCVSESHVLEDDPPVVFFGGPLHRDFQLLAVMAEQCYTLARSAYKQFAAGEPDLYHPLYDPDSFRWDGYDPAADSLFKKERLRLQCVSARRSRDLCTAALASRIAKQAMTAGAPIRRVLAELDSAVAAARTSEVLYYANYDDDCRTGAEGARLRQKLESIRSQFLVDCKARKDAIDDLEQPVPEPVRSATKRHAMIDWEKMTDLLPAEALAQRSGLYLSIDLGLARTIDYFCLGSVFTVQAQMSDGRWKTVFRRALLKRDTGWQHWDIPLDGLANQVGAVRLRLITDAYSRAIDRGAPSWRWGYWGRPRIIRCTSDGKQKLCHDLIAEIQQSRAYVQLDGSGQRRMFDGRGRDSSGATFQHALADPGLPEPARTAIAAFAPRAKGMSGVTIAEYEFTGVE
jgi:hypothetical protein